MSMLKADKQTFHNVMGNVCTLVYPQPHLEDTCRVSMTVYSSCGVKVSRWPHFSIAACALLLSLLASAWCGQT